MALQEYREFQEVSERVQVLYKKGLLKYLSGQRVHGSVMEVPTPTWRKLSQKYPKYQGIIEKLGAAISQAEFDRDTASLPESETLRILFFGFTDGDREGQYLMADILHYRVTEATEYFPIIKVPQEAHAMLVEYGFQDGLLTPATFHPLSLNAVVDRVLDGSIKLTPQTYKK